MAIVTQTLVDSDFELVTKHTISGTNGTALKVVDVSEVAGAATAPRVSIVSCQWTVSSTLNGNGTYNGGGQFLPSLANNAGSGITGDIYIENDGACVGTIILKMKKVSGFDNIITTA